MKDSLEEKTGTARGSPTVDDVDVHGSRAGSIAAQEAETIIDDAFEEQAVSFTNLARLELSELVSFIVDEHIKNNGGNITVEVMDKIFEDLQESKMVTAFDDASIKMEKIKEFYDKYHQHPDSLELTKIFIIHDKIRKYGKLSGIYDGMLPKGVRPSEPKLTADDVIEESVVNTLRERLERREMDAIGNTTNKK